MVSLNVKKIADRNYLLLSDSEVINYSIIISNEGDEAANFIRVRDLLSKGAILVSGSVAVNGCDVCNYSCNESIFIDSIAPGGNAFVTFQVTVNEHYPPQKIINTAEVSYFDINNKLMFAQSNELIIPVIDINVCMSKVSDKINASLGEIVSYTVFIRNNSTINIDNVIFYDDIQSDLVLIPESVKINSVPKYTADLSQGLELGTINSMASILINFDVQISYPSVVGKICNVGSINFDYTLNDGGVLKVMNETIYSDCSETKIVG